MTEENPDKSAGANSGRSKSLVERAAGKMLLDPVRAPPESAIPPVATPTSAGAGVSLVDAAHPSMAVAQVVVGIRCRRIQGQGLLQQESRSLQVSIL